jgi:hypothetical protein
MIGGAAGLPAPLDPDERTVPRPWLLKEISDWLADDRERVFLLSGDAGSGKSVVSGWVWPTGTAEDAIAVAQGVEPQLARVRAAWSAAYVCSQRYVGSSVDPRAFVRDVSEQLCRSIPGFHAALMARQRPLVQGTASAVTASGPVVGVQIEQLVIEGTTVEELYREALETPLRLALEQDPERSAVLLVDGLDEALGEDWPTIVDLCASLARMSSRVRLLVTTQNDHEATEAFTGIVGAGLRHIDLSSAELRPNVDDDIERLVRELPGGRALSVGALRRVRDAAMGSFLQVQALVDDIAEPRGAAPEPTPGGNRAERYERQLRRLLRRHFGTRWREAWEASIARFLGLLAVARSPVSLTTLAAWMDVPTTEVRMHVDCLEQLVKLRGDAVWPHHPAFAAYLRSPSVAPEHPNPFAVDPPEMERRIVQCYVDAISRAPRGWRDCDDYGLLHLPTHLAVLAGKEADRPQLTRAIELLLDPAYRQTLRRNIPDSLAIGRPFRRLATLLLDLDRTDLLERLLADTAGAEEAAVRATAVDGLLEYAERHPTRAHRLMCRMVVSPSFDVRRAALRATARLDRPAQAAVFAHVVQHGEQEARVDAAYAVYSNWSNLPVELTRGVLYDLAATISPLRPRRLRAMLEFLAHVTITTYVNHCSDEQVAELTSDLWRYVLVERLHVNVLNRPLFERTVIAPAMARHLATRVLDAAIGYDGPGQGSLLDLPEDDAASARRAIDGLDPAMDVGRLEADLARLLTSEIVAFRILAAQVLAVHAITTFDATAPLLERLFAGGPVRARTSTVLSLSIVLPDAPHAWTPALEAMIATLLDDDPSLEDCLRDPLLADLDLLFVPLGLAYCRTGARMALHERLIASASLHPNARRTCIAGTAVVGLYHPAVALAAFEPAVQADEAFLATHAVEALGLIANLHPAVVTSWLEHWGGDDVHRAVDAASQQALAHRYLELLGLYTNGVHQAIHYPFMRQQLLETSFRLLLDARSRKEWGRRYSRHVLDGLRRADYTLINWTR